jgi:DMSO/TMAO reductase YedYZ molybdopterin-dependent catalytic subunit
MSGNGFTRRRLLSQAGAAGLALASRSAWADASVDLPLPGGPTARPLTTDFPQKGEMILQRARPPLLETPFEVFDDGVFTPNDRFYVRWHWSGLPTSINVDKYRLDVRGHVERPLALALKEILSLPQFEIAAVNQCSGNSRGLFQPRVAGGEWGNGAMGNARWSGVRLKDVLDLAGVKAGAIQVRFSGLDDVVTADAPRFRKSLDVDHARDGEVMIAYAMNGEQLPLLNGFPLRVVVPGWYGAYWIKTLSDIEVLESVDDNFWMKSAYLIPDPPQANMKPGEPDVKMIPINRMAPRSFITNLKAGQTVSANAPILARGIAFGGDTAVARVDFSSDAGKTWTPATLGADQGKYSFRRWEAGFTLTDKGAATLAVRCANDGGVVQPDKANWNPSGFMRNVVEQTPVVVV